MDYDDRDTSRYLRAVEDRFRRIENAHNQLVKSLQDDALRVEGRQRMEHYQKQRDVVRDAHERGQAYTNVILTVGYAGFFGLWAITKDYQWPRLQALALVFIAISMCCFVGWEILQAAIRSALPDEPEHLTVNESPKKHWYTRSNIVKVWAWFFVPAVATGLLAAALLMTVLIARAIQAFRVTPTHVGLMAPTDSVPASWASMSAKISTPTPS